ncbi:hypothetical protein ECNE037_3516, partial [Escherichia coli NE037]
RNSRWINTSSFRYFGFRPIKINYV